MAETDDSTALEEVSSLTFSTCPSLILRTQRLKAALWYSIGKIVDEETLTLGINATPQFIGALTEMVWAQIETVSKDVEGFANHAGRKTVGVDDVMLLTRRNEGLEAILRAFVDGMKEKEDGGREKGKGKK
jgi:centromere protein S